MTDLKSLSERLGGCPKVSRYDKNDEPGGWALAYVLSEVEESSVEFLDDLLPKLMDPSLSDPDEIWKVLHAVGEVFRHILYHLRDSEYYGYLSNDSNSQDGGRG